MQNREELIQDSSVVNKVSLYEIITTIIRVIGKPIGNKETSEAGR